MAEIKRIVPLSLGIIQATIGFFMGFLVLLGMFILSLTVPTAPTLYWTAILIPVFYAIVSFFAGLLLAVFFNWSADWFGGLKLHLLIKLPKEKVAELKPVKRVTKKK